MKTVKDFEKSMIEKSMEILEKQEISWTEEKIVADTVQLITFTHSLNYRHEIEPCE